MKNVDTVLALSSSVSVLAFCSRRNEFMFVAYQFD